MDFHPIARFLNSERTACEFVAGRHFIGFFSTLVTAEIRFENSERCFGGQSPTACALELLFATACGHRVTVLFPES